MKKTFIALLFLISIMSGCGRKKVEQERLCARIDLERIVELFPKNSDDIDQMVLRVKTDMDNALSSIDGVKAHDRTYLNTLIPYEQASFQFTMTLQILVIFSQLAQNASLQLSANVAVHDLQRYQTEHIVQNIPLYRAFAEYEEHGKDPYHRSKSVQFFLTHTHQEGEQRGLNLSVAQRTDLLRLEKEIQQLCGRYFGNIMYDQRHILVDSQDLAGVPEEFIEKLHKDSEGRYVLSSDMQTFFTVMENCVVEQTRKEYFSMHSQLAYPQNDEILLQLIRKRNELAQLLGYQNFASYQIDNLMLKQSKKVTSFLWSMVKDVQPYDDRDFVELIKRLPPSVQLTSDKKMKPWDEALVKSWYRKTHFNVNDFQLANYFPLNHVLPAMLEQFQSKFNLVFEQEPDQQAWADNILCYRVRSLQHQAVIGYVFLDLYKRAGKKIDKECLLPMIPTLRDDCSTACIGAAVVVTNMSPATEQQPTLLEFNEVITLFHEFGHALHALLGATRFTKFSGVQVVSDFIEVPSTMLELWFDDPQIIKAISKNWQTGQPLSRDMIDQLLAAQKFGKSGRMLKQLFMALLSYQLFSQSNTIDLQHLVSRLYQQVFKHVAYDTAQHIEAHFAHIAQQYAAAYYAYPISSVIAADLFAYIKQHEQDRQESWKRYISLILSPGGSRPPQDMIKQFLGRSFHKTAYLESL